MFLIAGTKGRAKIISSGMFFCPAEAGDRTYVRVAMKRTATVFFVPIADIGDLGEYVECQSCSATYDVAVLDLMREAEVMDSLTRGLQRLAASVIAADGLVTDDERVAVLDVLNDQWGIPYSTMELERDLALGIDSLRAVLEDAGSLMNVEGRETAVRAAVYFSAVDGHISDGELDVVLEAGAALGLSKAHLRGVLADAFGTEMDS